MLVRKASCGVVHSGLTERERCGANYREEMRHSSLNRAGKNGKVSRVSTHQVHEVQREYVDTAGDGGQRADDGGQNAETTCAEQKVLSRIQISQIWKRLKINARFFRPPTFS